MNLKDIVKDYRQKKDVQNLIDQIKKYSQLKVNMKGLKGSSKAFVLAALHAEIKKDILIILTTQEEANYFFNDLESVIEGQKIYYFPSPFKNDDPNYRFNPLTLERIDVLNTIKKPSSTGRIIVTYPEAISEFVVTQDDLTDQTSNLDVDNSLDIDFIIEYLHEYGFEQSDFVNEAGYFSLRGGIIDIFSFGNQLPYRIQLLDDKIESIREFDPETQLSVRKLDTITIIPNLEKENKIEKFVSLFEYISPETLVCYSNLGFIKDALTKHYENVVKIFQQNISNSKLRNPENHNLDESKLENLLKTFNCLDFSSKPYFNSDLEMEFEISPQPSFNKNFNILADNLISNQKNNITNFIFSESIKQVERIYAIFEDKNIDVKFVPIYKNIHNGFIDYNIKIACYTEHEIFQRFHKTKTKKVYSNDKVLSLSEIYKLRPGDYIVHINHGVGQFSGLEKIENNGKKQEAIRLVYAGGDLLYVSIHNLHKISRYVGKEGAEPKLHRLGSNTWENIKNKTKSRVKDIARDLIKLYAQRRALEGFQFSPDTYLQTELEASFMYEDTPDQAKSTEEIKVDMERPYPMDRLVCGDVGYGKTEVAIRAATKAVADSKQVAVLVPTTILAFQHFKTFSDRLSDFPAKVDYISRFKSSKQVTEIKKKLEAGQIDILIGTHKLISKEIKFKDLGLLIIDEEQKFGVAAKERLRSMKVNVDTLSLTATPIPRTLQFSLMGVRDLTVINTPPPNRQAVETFIKPFDRDMIRDAIEKELERKGQVFFVHNRIKDLEMIANIIREEVPYAKIATAHGRLESKDLEEIMLNFIDGYYDVLVSTNIIESGLDIPNANTIIINDAQNFGLSDLYQMRGRVGRSNIKAYCYLFIPSFTVITSDARKRLAAIEEFTDLGSGFHIAMRDLDIRGAGNLLGAEQSGFISEIGLDMYKKILEEAISELKLEEFGDLFQDNAKEFSGFKECQIDTDLEVMLPDAYVTNIEERLNLYNKLNRITEEIELQKFEKDLADRFGKLPYQTNDLLDLIRLKWLGRKLGIEKIIFKNKKFRAFFPYSNTKNKKFQEQIFEKILKFVKNNMYRCTFNEKTKGLELVITDLEYVDEGLDVLKRINQM